MAVTGGRETVEVGSCTSAVIGDQSLSIAPKHTQSLPLVRSK